MINSYSVKEYLRYIQLNLIDLAMFIRALGQSLPDSMKMIENTRPAFYLNEHLKVLEIKISTLVKEFKEERIKEVEACLSQDLELKQKFQEKFESKQAESYLGIDSIGTNNFRNIFIEYANFINPKLLVVNEENDADVAADIESFDVQPKFMETRVEEPMPTEDDLIVSEERIIHLISETISDFQNTIIQATNKSVLLNSSAIVEKMKGYVDKKAQAIICPVKKTSRGAQIMSDEPYLPYEPDPVQLEGEALIPSLRSRIRVEEFGYKITTSDGVASKLRVNHRNVFDNDK